MRLSRYITRNRIFELESEDFKGALKELLERMPERKGKGGRFSRKELLEKLIDREQTMSTTLGNGIALPHARVPKGNPYTFLIGRCPFGLQNEEGKEYRDVKIIILVLSPEGSKDYLNILASLARVLDDEGIVQTLNSAPDLKAFQAAVITAFGGLRQKFSAKELRFNRLMLRSALKVARGAKCNSMMVFGDTFLGGIDLPNHEGVKTVLVTQKETHGIYTGVDAFIPVRSVSNNRLSQLRSAIIVGLTRGIFKSTERICCVGGIPSSNQFDTVVVIDVEREFQSMFARHKDMMPPAVKPEVLERLLTIVTELSVEGREGHPVGCLFVLGDIKEIKPFTRPLILNPFMGYKEEDRNILSPFMDETVKEYSSLDGAFIIRGDGVLESAGTLLHTPEYTVELPGGYGARHGAAAAISMATDCIAIVVSSSTGQVTLFRKGQFIPIIERGFNRTI